MFNHGDSIKKELQSSGFLAKESRFQWNGTHNQDILIKTSDNSASIESAQSFLLGLYDSSASQIPANALPKLNVRTFTDDIFTTYPGSLRNLHIVRQDQDTFDPILMCPAVAAEMDKLSKNDELL